MVAVRVHLAHHLGLRVPLVAAGPEPEHPGGKLLGVPHLGEERRQHLARRAVVEGDLEVAGRIGLGFDPQQVLVAGADVEPDATAGAHVEAPAAAADHVGERHREVGLALGALALVLLEDDRVELRAAMVERVVALTEPRDPLPGRQRNGEADAVHPRAVAERARRPLDHARRADLVESGCPVGPAAHRGLEPAGALVGSHEAVAQRLADPQIVELGVPAAARARETRLRRRQVAAVDDLSAISAGHRGQRQHRRRSAVADEFEVDAGDPRRTAHAQVERLPRDGVDRVALVGVDRVRVTGAERPVTDHDSITPSSRARRRYMAEDQSSGSALVPHRSIHSSTKEESSR